MISDRSLQSSDEDFSEPISFSDPIRMAALAILVYILDQYY